MHILYRNGQTRMNRQELEQVAQQIICACQHYELADNMGGFYDLESIKDYLPDEFKNENLEDYIKY